MRVEWAEDALADLDRFAAFLEHEYPSLSKLVAQAIIEKAELLAEHPLLGREPKGARNTVRSYCGF